MNNAGTKELEKYLEENTELLEISKDENEELMRDARADVKERKARATRLQKLRKEKLHVSQSQLAKAVGANFRTLQSWEQGRQDYPDSVEILMTMMNKYANVRKALLGVVSVGKNHSNEKSA